MGTAPANEVVREAGASRLGGQTPRWRGIGRRLFCFMRNSLAVLGLLMLLYHLFFQVSMIASNSMSPTLRGDGGPGSDWIVSESVSYLFRKPRRWEVVQFHQEGVLVAKRVVGLPGEAVSLREKALRVNGQAVERPASLAKVVYYPFGALRSDGVIDCGQGYAVLGDNSVDSEDSRFVGPVAPWRIRGRAWLVVWPMSRFGFVNP